MAAPVPKTRILTALVLLGLVLLLLWRGTLIWLLGAFAAVTLRAAWEWAGLFSGLAGARRWWLLIALGACMTGMYALPAPWTSAVLIAALAWWMVSLRLVIRFPGVPGWIDRPAPQAIIILLALAPAWLALARLADGQRPLLLLCLALVWAADTGAYVTGRTLGKRKLCPQVSPGKTVAGLIGGLLGAAVVGLGAGLALGLDGLRLTALVGLIIACAAVSVIGDLAESLFKRRAGVKDSSDLLPGHGGVLDRIDALIAAAPLFALSVPLLVGG